SGFIDQVDVAVGDALVSYLTAFAASGRLPPLKTLKDHLEAGLGAAGDAAADTALKTALQGYAKSVAAQQIDQFQGVLYDRLFGNGGIVTDTLAAWADVTTKLSQAGL